ncbi:MAG: gliding motility lipoprotein GldH [Prevotellaceae bacterium]|jgi:gliding motility-associated lipoprotein GldH|nr:gliding motility lipoprotein GldH [Prevotellaceae bacterium]
MKRLLCSLTACIVLLCGCMTSTVNDLTVHTFPPEGWKRQDTIRFSLPLTDSVRTSYATLLLRRHPYYSFQNLAIEVKSYVGMNESVQTDTLYLHFLPEDTRERLQGHRPDLLETAVLLRELSPEEFDTDTVHFSITHLMNVSELLGLHDISIQLSN